MAISGSLTSKARFLATIERKPVDYPACWLGLPVPSALPGLYRHFEIKSVDGIKNIIKDDVYPVEVPYNNPPANHVACAFDFAKGQASAHERTLTSVGFFAGMSEPSEVNNFAWPVVSDHITLESCRLAFKDVPKDKAIMGIMWSAHFQDACAAFGMEEAMMTLLTEPDMFDAVINKIVDYYIEVNEIFYRAGQGIMDAVLIGNDFGSQQALMLSPELLRKHVFPGTQRLIEQAHSFGYKVVHHSCGAISEVIQDLVNLGADAIHPIQALARGMDAASLKQQFGNSASYCGGVDAQHLLVNGTAEEVRSKVLELKSIFPTGLIISPSHEAILPDIDPKKIEVLFKAVRE